MGTGQDRMEMGLPRVGRGWDKLGQRQAGMQEEARLHHSVPVPMGWDRGAPTAPSAPLFSPHCPAGPRAGANFNPGAGPGRPRLPSA